MEPAMTTIRGRLSPAVEEQKEASMIRMAGVSKRFALRRKQELTALEDFDLTVQSGEFLALLGPSGCGKSTALRLIAGLEQSSAGAVSVDGHAPGDLIRAHKLGIVFQEHSLLPWLSVSANIALPFQLAGRAVNRGRIAEMIKLVGLEGFEGARPRQLSGGMRQRVAIARALILEPEVLLLDEPFGALDAVTRRRMNLSLSQIWSEQRITTVLVTHDVAEAALLADRIIVMTSRPGKVREDRAVHFERPRGPEVTRQPEFHDLVDELTLLLDSGADT
jgi:NitT/TauT family transport system ATP-binding protein